MSPAHLRPIAHKCDAPGCERTATEALHNGHNARIGSYCKRHAAQALKQFQDEYEQREATS